MRAEIQGVGVRGPSGAAAAGWAAHGTPVPGDEDPPLDLDALDDLRTLGEPAFRELVSGFAARLVPTVEELRAVSGDPVATSRLAHRLKGGSGTFGARRVAALCGQLEDPPAQATALRSLLDRLLEEALLARDALTRLLAADPRPAVAPRPGRP